MRWLFVLLILASTRPALAFDDITFKVMSFNIWHGGHAGGQPLSQTANAMKLADIVGLQETHHDESDSSAILAKQLGWHHFQQGGRTAVVSRFPISGHTPKKWGVYVQVDEESKVCFFNCHLAAQPYQPYQLLKIPYGDAPFITTESEAIQWAKKSRGAALHRMLVEVVEVQACGIPCIITGDFNEPSHLDWTQAAKNAGLHPIKVQYPASKAIENLNFVDSFRNQHSDEVKSPGQTWTPNTLSNDPADHHDRIDFVYASQSELRVQQCEVVGESKLNASIVISPWPSDHRAVLATVRIVEGSVAEQAQ